MQKDMPKVLRGRTAPRSGCLPGGDKGGALQQAACGGSLMCMIVSSTADEGAARSRVCSNKAPACLWTTVNSRGFAS